MQINLMQMRIEENRIMLHWRNNRKVLQLIEKKVFFTVESLNFH